ncbi:MAG: YceI family protein [Caldithrix sp.]|nr:MAG: YceI family protein [Caldithrix sp.]
MQNYPEITFKSKRIKKDGDALTVTGDLTIMGVTKEVTFPFELVGPVADPWGNQRIGLAASLTVNRYDFGMGFDRKLKGGEPMIGSDIMISLSLEAIPAKESGTH